MASKTPKTAPTTPGKAVAGVANAVTKTAITQAEATKPVATAAAKAATAPVAAAAKVAQPVAKAIEPAKPAAPPDVKAAMIEAPAKVAAAVKAPVATAKAARRTVAKAVKPVAKAVKTAIVEPVKKAVETAVTATPEVAPTQKKDVTFMATKFETPKMFNDVSERAKAMFSKSQTSVADMGEFGKGNVEAMVEAGKIAAKGMETLGQDAADYTRRSFEGMTAALKSLSSVKSPTEFFQLQSEYVRSAFDQAVAQSSKTTEAMIKLTSDAAQPLSNRFAVAVEKVKTAA